MEDYLHISKYINIVEQTDEERINEFYRTINSAVDSVSREKYGPEMLAYIVNVACNRVADLFITEGVYVIKDELDESPVTIDRQQAYASFEKQIRNIIENSDIHELNPAIFYHSINDSYNELEKSLGQDGYCKVRKLS